MAAILYILIAMALGQGAIALRDGWRNARYAGGYRRPDWHAGRVQVFCPVRGADPDLEDNARSLLGQTCPEYRVVFLLDDPEDPAVAVLSKLGGARLEIGGRAAGRSRKVHNLLHGITRFGSDADIWVFADADARFPPEWLAELVAPLGSPGVGASTGYRWYVPQSGSGASLLRSAWNATVAGFLGPHGGNFAWGGSMAIRREVFDAAGIERLWAHAVSDDYALTRGVREQGLRVAFVPTCLVPAYGACSWRELLEFTTRQVRITRVYAPAVWRLGFVSNTLFSVAFLWVTVWILLGHWGLILPWLAIYLLTVVRSELRRKAAARTIGDPSLWRYRWFYRLATPLVALLYEINFLLSLASRRIAWKGDIYTMVSPERTHVKNGDREHF